MNAKQLFIPLALIGVCSVETTPANAAVISFSEDPNEAAAIVVTTDIVGATIAAGIESANLSLGTATGPSTLLFRRQMTNAGTMTGEGGGSGVSDVLELDSFVSAAGETVAFWRRSSPTPRRVYRLPRETSLQVTNLVEAVPGRGGMGAAQGGDGATVDFSEDRAIGPGKIRLLEAIRDTGSITQAGIALGMSYRRAWLLVYDMNNCFHEAVIAAQAGGSHGGGASLTPFGERLIDQYRAIEAEAHAATVARLGALEAACKAPAEPTPATKSHAAPRRRTIAR